MNYFYAFVVFLLVSTTAFAQKKPKIKGDRNVTEITNEIVLNFNAIEVDDALEVTLQQGNRNSYSLETDENLVSVIRFSVQNGILKIFTTHRITNSKRLAIHVTVTDLQKIILKNDAEIKGESVFESDIFEVTAYNSSKVDIEVETKTFNIMMQHNATGKFKVRTEKATITMDDRTDVNADIRADELTITTTKNAELKLDGNADRGQFSLNDSSKIDAERTKISEINLIADKNTNAYVFASRDLKINAKGDSTVYVYGNPDIVIEKFADKARMIKK